MVLATLGSLGDLHPFMAVALALQKRGADVVLASAAEYRDKVERAGLEFRAVRPSFDDMQNLMGMDRTQLTKALLERSDFLFRKLVGPSLRAAYDDMRDVINGADLVLTSSLGLGARLAAERRGIPWIAVVLQPMMFLSAFDPPVIPGAEWLTPVLRRLGPVATGLALSGVKWGMNAMLRPLHTLRAEIGLPATRRDALFDGQFSRWGAIGLYSSVLGDIQPDYPRPTVLAGFAMFDSDDGASVALEPGLSMFLDAGTAPLVFTLGSLVVNSPGDFYRHGLDAARRLGKRAVLMVGADAAVNFPLPKSADLHVCGYAPHSLVFPRAEAIVHQGGIGTLAQALCAGRPQLIVPFYADQSDNAARAVRLGVARSLRPSRYDDASAARELAQLATVGEYRVRARDVAAVLAAEDGAATAASVVFDRLESMQTKCRSAARSE